MSAFVDLKDQRFGRLTVIRRAGSSGGAVVWECLCDCGQTTFLTGWTLKSGNTMSCGCLKRELDHVRHFKHGLTSSSEHAIWTAMIQRCTNPKNKDYHRYGGRGIDVCQLWRDFMAFYLDMGQRPSSLHSLERRDNNAGYSKDNCYWATKEQQSYNTSSNRWLTANGKTQTLTQWSKELGLSPASLRDRLENGWSMERALSTRRTTRRELIELNGVTTTIKECAGRTGIRACTIAARLRAGWDDRAAALTPVRRANARS